MFYYLEKNNNIVIADNDLSRLQTTLDFLPQYQGLEIKESDVDIVQFGENNKWYFVTDEEYIEKKRQAEEERLSKLTLTKADFWIALLDKDVTKKMVKEKAMLIPDEKLRAKTLIRIDDADHFWRGDAAMDIIGGYFGITKEELDYLFENGHFSENPEDNIEEVEEL